MVRMSTLADCLKNMTNAEKRGKRQALIRPASTVIIRVLKVMQKHGYIGDFEVVDNHRGNKIVVELNGRLNKCGVVSPRYAQACFSSKQLRQKNIEPSFPGPLDPSWCIDGVASQFREER